MSSRSLVLALLVTLGCSERARVPGQATVLIDSPPETLDGRLAFSSNAQRLSSLIAPGLVTFGDDGEAVPDLAASFEADSPTSWTFHLKPGVHFHDGAALTSADVLATFASVRDPALKSPLASKLDTVEAVEAPDALTVKVRLKRPYAPILADLAFPIYPAAHLAAAEAPAFGRHPIGAGPFRFESWRDEEHLLLAPFAGGSKAEPKLAHLEIRVVRDETTRVLELMHGRADLVVSGISPQLLGVLRDAPGLAVETVPGTGHAYLALNLRDKTLADVRVRRALSCALHRAELAEFKFEGTATPATGLLPRHNWAYAPEPVCDNDPVQAMKLLDEAGFPDPGGGRPRLVLSLKSSTDRFRKSVAGVIAAQVARAGIQLDLRSLEFGTFSRDVKEGSFQVATLKWSAVLEPDLLRWAYDSKFVPTSENHFEGLNRQAYRSASFDALVESATASDAKARAALYADAQAQLAADLPTIPLWHEDVVVVRSRALQGFVASPHGFLGGLAAARLVEP